MQKQFIPVNVLNKAESKTYLYEELRLGKRDCVRNKQSLQRYAIRARQIRSHFLGRVFYSEISPFAFKLAYYMCGNGRTTLGLEIFTRTNTCNNIQFVPSFSLEKRILIITQTIIQQRLSRLVSK